MLGPNGCHSRILILLPIWWFLPTLWAAVTPVLVGSALAFYDGYRSKRLPANVIQAQRDSFGAHRYERIDEPRGQFFHSTWEA